MSTAGHGSEELFATLVVETVNQFGIVEPPCVAGNFHHGVLFPQSARITKCGDAALSAYASACQYCKFPHCCMCEFVEGKNLFWLNLCKDMKLFGKVMVFV